ncbi:GntP family permease [Microbacterium sp. NPDC078428]|uniref:GntP family permease n=1 Tax=Microbacterium sp. NPDC078428 TaxID=3364190 RepID=UPI0037CCBF79
MEDWTQTLGTLPLLGIAAGAIALILVMIIVFKVHAFLTLIVVSLLTAFVAGVPVSAIAATLTGGFGGTLGTVALLVALGAMLGRLIEHSGGAKALADKFVEVFGEKRAPFALGIASLILGFPMFFDAGLVMMLPIIFAIARRVSTNNVLLFGIPAAAAFSVMHVFLPPHPGPVTASELYGANLGIVLVVGLVIAFPVWYVSGYLWGKFVAARIPLPVPNLFGGIDEDQPVNPPKPRTIILLLLLPMLLIFLNTGLTTLGAAGIVPVEDLWAQTLILLGNSAVALLITVIVAMIVLGRRRGENGSALEKIVDSALGPVASVILITGAGGMFGAVLRASGIGDALADSLSALGLPIIFAAYIIAVVIRLAQGSATVALVTAAGLAAPAVIAGDFNPLQIAAITLATAAGSVFAGHVNDSGFWLVGRLMGMDVKTTLKTWTVQQTIESVLAFALVLVVYGIGSML